LRVSCRKRHWGYGGASFGLRQRDTGDTRFVYCCSMQNQPGYSWGCDASVNLMRSSKGWLAFYCHPDGTREIIKIFNLSGKHYYEYCRMMDQLTIWNYGTLNLCPIVREEIDSTA